MIKALACCDLPVLLEEVRKAHGEFARSRIATLGLGRHLADWAYSDGSEAHQAYRRWDAPSTNCDKTNFKHRIDFGLPLVRAHGINITSNRQEGGLS